MLNLERKHESIVIMNIFKYVNRFISTQKKYMFLYLLCNILSAVLSLSNTIIGGEFINVLVSADSMSVIYRYCIVLFVVNAICILIGIAINYLYTKTQASAAFDINVKLIEHMKRLSYYQYSEMDMSYVNQRINNDANSVTSFVITTIASIIVQLIMLILSIIILKSLNPLILVVCVIACILYVVLYLTLKKELYKSGYEFKEIQANFFSNLYEQLSSIRFITIHAANSIYLSKLKGAFGKFWEKLISYQKLSFTWDSLDKTISSLANIILYLIIALEVYKGNITIGGFTIIMSVFNSIISTCKYFLELGKSYQSNLIAYQRIAEIENLKTITFGEKKLSSIDNIEIESGTLHLGQKDLTYSKKMVFEKGKIYCIKGENGCGKSSIFNLILGLYDNEYDGKVKFNDIDIHNINMEYLIRTKIAIVDQEPQLMQDTIRNNIILNKSVCGVDMEIINALRLDGLFLAGADTIVNDKMSNISGGEKQKISLANAFMDHRDLILLDEPTSAFDKESIEGLVELVQKRKPYSIIIIISHDDRIINMSDVVLEFPFQ